MPILNGEKREMVKIHVRRSSEAEVATDLAAALGDLISVAGPVAGIAPHAIADFVAHAMLAARKGE